MKLVSDLSLTKSLPQAFVDIFSILRLSKKVGRLPCLMVLPDESTIQVSCTFAGCMARQRLASGFALKSRACHAAFPLILWSITTHT